MAVLTRVPRLRAGVFAADSPGRRACGTNLAKQMTNLSQNLRFLLQYTLRFNGTALSDRWTVSCQ